MKNKSDGFTLVEMLVVIGIIGIMMTGIVSSEKCIAHYKFESLVEQAGEMIQLGQQMATLKNGVYTIQLTEMDKKQVLKLGEGSHEPIQRLVIPHNVTVKFSTSEKNIQFEGDMSPSKAATLCMKHKSLGKEIHITVRVATGKITFYENEQC